jgi:hypothetical protein
MRKKTVSLPQNALIAVGIGVIVNRYHVAAVEIIEDDSPQSNCDFIFHLVSGTKIRVPAPSVTTGAWSFVPDEDE